VDEKRSNGGAESIHLRKVVGTRGSSAIKGFCRNAVNGRDVLGIRAGVAAKATMGDTVDTGDSMEAATVRYR
jgi:hypothetical protein